MVETKENTGMWSAQLGGLLAMCVAASFLCVFSVLPHFCFEHVMLGDLKRKKEQTFMKSQTGMISRGVR